MDLTIETWNAMIAVLETGEHCPHHIKCKKPFNK
jgi:phosphoethanolamine N-methyltransferase